MVKGLSTRGTLPVAVASILLLANCANIATLSTVSPSAAGPEVMSVQDARVGYASQGAVPPPGFVEVAEFRSREACQAQGHAHARVVGLEGADGASGARNATALQFECID